MKTNKTFTLLTRILRYPLRIWMFYIPGMIGFAGQDLIIILFTTILQKKAIDVASAGNVSQDVLISLFLFLAIYIAINLVMFFLLTLYDYSMLKAQNLMKHDFMHAVLSNPYRFLHHSISTADLRTRMMEDCSTISIFGTYQVGTFLMPVLKMIGCAIAIIVLNPKSVVYIPLFCLIPIIYSLALSGKVRNLQQESRKSQSDFLHQADAVLKNFDVVKACRTEAYFKERLQSVVERQKRLRISKVYVDTGRVFTSSLLNAVLLLITMLHGLTLYTRGELSLSTVLVLPVFAAAILSGAEAISTAGLAWQQTRVSAERFFEVLDGEAINDSGDTSEEAALQVPDAGGSTVTVENLCFQYDKTRGISDISAVFPEGEVSCICGEIGSGKSTLIKTILGLEKKTEGSVRVGNIGQDFVPQTQWSSLFSCVLQPAKLFLGTVKDNILLGNKYDESRFQYVLEITGLSETVKRMQDGIDTKVMDESANLSGGERQLICFARALYSPAPVLILDEFSSDFDADHDRIALGVLDAVTKQDAKIKKTVLLISHKQEFIDCADHVFEMSAGGRLSQSR